MAAEPEAPASGRYGRPADARADRTLKIVGAVLGTALLGFVAWAGVHYITQEDVSAQLLRSRPVSDSEAQAVLEIRKEKDATAVCTVRSLGEDGGEVGRKDVTLDRREAHFTTLVTVRTTSRPVATELKGCRTVPGSGD
ncbi:membrane protein [Streptomyces mashuensis]|uniref:Membrane protein n=1 Tax=Streptomyces mashuensis TaxID=33904 RepID=A0A919EF35_9ACTN|nr:DUF4307 domain-containing protein [Streptomyces mashuensis]GHF61744.1 membrane protein [Streptomyces mashuensis]